MTQKSNAESNFNINVCHEIQIHYRRPLFNEAQKISSSEDAERILRAISDVKRIDHKEFFWLILVSNANQVLGVSEIGVGCTSGVNVNIKEICQLALLTNASGVLIAHNHPSGTLKPSQADHKITKKIKTVLQPMDINLLDHIIITSEDYISFVDDNLM